MKLLLKLILAAALLAASILLSNGISAALFSALEQSGQEFLYEYATEGRFDYNVYLSQEVNGRTGILDEVLMRLDDDEIHSMVSLAGHINRYQVELLPVFFGNSAYMDYLRGQDTGLTELFLFCKNLDELTDNLDYICRYLLFLAWVTALHFLLKCRPVFYAGMGALCVFATSLRLSNRLFAGFFANGKVIFHLFADDLVPAMLEAMLTFLIFDITFAALEKQHISDRLSPLYADLPALTFLVTFLSGFVDCETSYRPNLHTLLPHFMRAAHRPPRGKKGKRFLSAVQALDGPHTNRTLIRDLVTLQSLLPPQ